MNESETRAELIDPLLKSSGWREIAETKILREYYFTTGKIVAVGGKRKPLKADYILTFKGQKLAVIEAKSDELDVSEGVAQAKNYAQKLNLMFAYSTNGKEIYQINLETGDEGLVDAFPTPQQLWDQVFPASNDWLEKFNSIPFEDIGGSKPLYYFQEIAVNKTLSAIASGQDRILLTLATGTGKTFIAFQIVWKLFYSRWNIKLDGSRRPRVLFLTDRNILADQAFNAFNPFPEDALVRIKPSEIRRRGRVPTNGSIFFTIFQTFMSGSDVEGKPTPSFGEYPRDYFDLIIIDECHRGGANDESTWRAILEFFSPAVQIGLTATPKRTQNIDTYRYFGNPVYIYSLKEGINDGFLTPFKVKRIQTTIDEYVYTSDDIILEGEVEEGKIYTEAEFNKIIEIIERESKRVKIVLSEIDPRQKTIIFCASQLHAAAIRDLINQNKSIPDPDYCHRVTADDGKFGEEHLRYFQDNDKTIPAILTTSHKLSTGVDARNIRNIVLLRPINSIIEFKQIIGRGTRLFDGKFFFTIYDFVNAYHHFFDPEWDGEPLEPVDVTPKKPPEPCPVCGQIPCVCPKLPPDPPPEPKRILKIKLRDGKEREIQHMIATSFWSPDGNPISAEQFLRNLFGRLPDFFKDENELREIWSVPSTRKSLLDNLEEAGFGREELHQLQKVINAENSDLFDVLEYVSYARKPISRSDRVSGSKSFIFANLQSKQVEFIDFVLSKYIESGVSELDQDKLSILLNLKYHTITDATENLGNVELIKDTFISFQKYLYNTIQNWGV